MTIKFGAQGSKKRPGPSADALQSEKAENIKQQFAFMEKSAESGYRLAFKYPNE